MLLLRMTSTEGGNVGTVGNISSVMRPQHKRILSRILLLRMTSMEGGNAGNVRNISSTLRSQHKHILSRILLLRIHAPAA